MSLILGLQAVSDADERGMRTVMCTINGQLRPIRVRDAKQLERELLDNRSWLRQWEATSPHGPSGTL